MSFFEDIRGDESSRLRNNAKESLDRALNTLEKTVDNGFEPYYNFDLHLKSLAHPVYSIFQLARNALRLTYSAVVLTGALVSFNGRGAASALGNMVNIVLASVVEIINIACSMISFATRTLASMGGYNSDTTSLANERAIHKTAFTLV
ncbi:MAG: hypothetical protein GW760_01830 [Legionella sp.]|jgi:hypothetical protein|nr:hypothetical protein [Legionella sp.]